VIKHHQGCLSFILFVELYKRYDDIFWMCLLLVNNIKFKVI